MLASDVAHQCLLGPAQRIIVPVTEAEVTGEARVWTVAFRYEARGEDEGPSGDFLALSFSKSVSGVGVMTASASIS